jgi:hypothetical protein
MTVLGEIAGICAIAVHKIVLRTIRAQPMTRMPAD